MFVGVIHPELLRIYTYDGQDYEWHETGDEHVNKWGHNEIPDKFDYLLTRINLHYDVLIILSTPMPYIPALKAIADKYANYVSVHPVIAGVLTEFINEHFNEDMATKVKKTFAVIIDGDGYDYYKFTVSNPKEFELAKSVYHAVEIQLNFESLAVPPEYILIGYVVDLIPDADVADLCENPPFGMNVKIPIQSQPIEDFLMTAFRGGIRIALSRVAETSDYKIHDFCEKTYVSIGGHVSTVSPWGAPYDRKFKNEHHMDRGHVRVYTSNSICFDVDNEGNLAGLRRKSETVFWQSRIPKCVVTLKTYVDQFGVAVFELHVPPIVVQAKKVDVAPVAVKKVRCADVADFKHKEQIYGNVFPSNKMLVIGAGVLEHPAIEAIPTGTVLTAQHIHDFYTKFFNDIPVSELKTFVLAHDGTYPAPLINTAIDLARQVFDDKQVSINVVSPQTVMFFYHLRKTPYQSDATNFYTIAMFITADMFTAVYIRHHVADRTHQIIDSWRVSFKTPNEAFQHIHSGKHDGPTFTYQSVTLYADDIEPYKPYCHQFDIRYKQLSPAWFEHNVLHLASHLNSASAAQLIDRNAMVIIKFNRSRGVVFYDGKDVGNSYQRRIEIPAGTRKIKLYQNVSHRADSEFVLFETHDVPEGLDSVLISLEFHGFTNLPTVTMVPNLCEFRYSAPKID
uniref:Pyr_redox_2 domain-containing protein n=1 Tax=Panagrellus redivivus TaxID=6233 RepID=A0A7E4VPF9_PANRE